MAKRFTDTDKWKRPWFCGLNQKAKLAWVYILDQCDYRGVWFANFKLASQQLGYRVNKEQFDDWFGDKILALDDDKYFIKSFVDFQYKSLNPNNNAHKGIINLINNLGAGQPLKDINEPLSEGLKSPLQGAQVTEHNTKNKVKVKEKEEPLVLIKNNATAKFDLGFDKDFALFRKAVLDECGYTPQFESLIPDMYLRWQKNMQAFIEFIDGRKVYSEKLENRTHQEKQAWLRKALISESRLDAEVG